MTTYKVIEVEANLSIYGKKVRVVLSCWFQSEKLMGSLVILDYCPGLKEQIEH